MVDGAGEFLTSGEAQLGTCSELDGVLDTLPLEDADEYSSSRALGFTVVRLHSRNVHRSNELSFMLHF